MQKITPHLWYNKEAVEAANFYVSAFGGDSKINNINKITDTPSGDCNIVSFKILGYEFMSISAGPLFKFTPAISFFVACETKEDVDELWNKLFPGGSALMPLDKYPFSERYGWLQDKFGLSWQIMYMNGNPIKNKIIPTLMYIGANCGKTEEAMNFYASIFHNSEVNFIMRYNKGEEPDKEGTIKHAGFILEGQQFAAMDSAYAHKFSFSEAISFIVNCDTQEEIDYYWNKLSAVPEAEQCGWLKDKYGVSWQIVPTEMEQLMNTKDEKKLNRITQAFLKMKKFDIAILKKAAVQN